MRAEADASPTLHRACIPLHLVFTVSVVCIESPVIRITKLSIKIRHQRCCYERVRSSVKNGARI